MKFQINIHETINNFFKYLNRIFAKGIQLIVRLDCFSDKPQARVPGSARGKIRVSEDFDEPLPEDILQDFKE